MKIASRIKPPKQGQTRFKRAFAWLPTYAGGACIWLEKYEIMEAWIVIQYPVIVEGKQQIVAHGEWKAISTRVFNKNAKPLKENS